LQGIETQEIGNKGRQEIRMSIDKMILDSYGETNSVKKVERETGYSWCRIVKTLATHGIATSDLHRRILHLYQMGVTREEIAFKTGLAVRTVDAYLPRKRDVVYGEAVTENAQRCLKSRQRRGQRDTISA
jgi:hypothetical protein